VQPAPTLQLLAVMRLPTALNVRQVNTLVRLEVTKLPITSNACQASTLMRQVVKNALNARPANICSSVAASQHQTVLIVVQGSIHLVEQIRSQCASTATEAGTITPVGASKIVWPVLVVKLLHLARLVWKAALFALLVSFLIYPLQAALRAFLERMQLLLAALSVPAVVLDTIWQQQVKPQHLLAKSATQDNTMMSLGLPHASCAL
jgi:hypothetical protein